MDLALAGRTALVCGASSGMGLAIASALRAEGANVAMMARRADVLAAEAERIGGLAVVGDVSVAADRERAVAETVAAYGGVDVLLNNSGGPPAGSALAAAEPDAIRAAVELLLVSAVHLTMLCLPHLERSGRGRIVNIESISVREPIDGLVLSNAVRPGVVGWAKTLAREVAAKGITVNTICPGRIDTGRLRSLYESTGRSAEADMAAIPAGRFGEPSEIADAVLFLASERAAYITGTVIPVDGGLSRSLL